MIQVTAVCMHIVQMLLSFFLHLIQAASHVWQDMVQMIKLDRMLQWRAHNKVNKHEETCNLFYMPRLKIDMNKADQTN